MIRDIVGVAMGRRKARGIVTAVYFSLEWGGGCFLGFSKEDLYDPFKLGTLYIGGHLYKIRVPSVW